MRVWPCKIKRNMDKPAIIYYSRYKREIEKGVIPFNIIVHFPTDREMQRELSKRVAIVHAQAITQKVKSLSCPLEQKIALLDAVKRYIENEDGG